MRSWSRRQEEAGQVTVWNLQNLKLVSFGTLRLDRMPMTEPSIIGMIIIVKHVLIKTRAIEKR
jgi:hypothetical protein